ncbi:MAG: ACP S-malonyltransferase [Nitrospirae bacterium]|nr:ACP S-malonyltransferase [Nitrospirota bacterium]
MRKIAFIFPGQGSQYPGMGKEFFDNYTEAKDIFDEADNALGFPISQLCFNGPKEALSLTENTQPAILTVSIAAFEVFKKNGIMSSVVAGHSLGEYSAVVAGGGISFYDAVKLVKKRGQFMQEAYPEGKGMMAAIIGLDKEALNSVCKEASNEGVISPANMNSPVQVVIAGEKNAVQRAMELAKQKGAKKIVPLSVSVPSHCKLMEPVGKRLEAELNKIDIKNLSMPLINNADAKAITDSAELKDSLVRQLSYPLLWVDSVMRMIEIGVDTFIEVGPGTVLSGLVKRINKDVNIFNVEDKKSLEDTLKRIVVD